MLPVPLRASLLGPRLSGGRSKKDPPPVPSVSHSHLLLPFCHPQICFLMAVNVIGQRMNFMVILHGCWLVAILTRRRRRAIARLWPNYCLFLTLFLLYQYLLCLGIPPALCIGEQGAGCGRVRAGGRREPACVAAAACSAWAFPACPVLSVSVLLFRAGPYSVWMYHSWFDLSHRETSHFQFGNVGV